jgi:hypothetical protein
MDTEAVVRRAFDAFNLRQTEAFLELFDGDAEIVPLRARTPSIKVATASDGSSRTLTHHGRIAKPRSSTSKCQASKRW